MPSVVVESEKDRYNDGSDQVGTNPCNSMSIFIILEFCCSCFEKEKTHMALSFCKTAIAIIICSVHGFRLLLLTSICILKNVERLLSLVKLCQKRQFYDQHRLFMTTPSVTF